MIREISKGNLNLLYELEFIVTYFLSKVIKLTSRVQNKANTWWGVFYDYILGACNTVV